jgi:phage gp46-like protein
MSIMADLSFKYDSEKGFADISIVNGDFKIGDELETAVGLSLFTDRRSTASEAQIIQLTVQGRQSRRGYWANTFRPVAQGSGLWTLERAKSIPETESRARRYCNDALNWLIADGIAKDVSTTASIDGDTLSILVSITKPTGENAEFNYEFAWDSIEVI